MSTVSTYARTSEQPWLAHYPDRVPATYPPAARNGVALFRQAVETRPDGAALHYFETTLTNRELEERAHALASALRELGVVQGDRVALYLQNVPQFIVALQAAWLLGAIVNPVNPMCKEREVRYQLTDAGSKVIIALESLASTVEAARDGTALEHLITTSELEFLDEVPALLAGVERVDVPGALKLEELLAAHADRRVEPVDPDPSEPALLCYTSGTTGPPKAAMNTHANIAAGAEFYVRLMDGDETDVVLGTAPLFHITGITGHIAVSIRAAAPLVLFYRFDAGEWLRMVERWRPTFTIGAITAYVAVMNHPDFATHDLSSLTKVFTGGAPVSPALAERFRDATGTYMHNTYGMTETSFPTHAVPLGMRAPVDPSTGALSVGLPTPNVLSTIIDQDTGAELPVGELGQIVSAGPGIVAGYWNNQAETDNAIRGGFMHTGDIGTVDDDGWFYLIDRSKDMIVAGGYKVWPREVEDVLNEHHAVLEAAVVGVPDDYRGETVKAVVALRRGTTVTPEELTQHCRERMSAYKYPRIVEIVDELPKTATGKLLRRALR
jgi:long-chain acyl-CoA synthetase